MGKTLKNFVGGKIKFRPFYHMHIVYTVYMYAYRNSCKICWSGLISCISSRISHIVNVLRNAVRIVKSGFFSILLLVMILSSPISNCI